MPDRRRISPMDEMNRQSRAALKRQWAERPRYPVVEQVVRFFKRHQTDLRSSHRPVAPDPAKKRPNHR